MLTVGLTGGIASGKSILLRAFKRHGAVVIDADKLARQLVLPHKEAWQQIYDSFGETMFYKNGRLNRAAVAKLVFKDEAARKKLNQILHPKILAEEKRQIAALKNRKGILIIDAALMIETGSHKWKDVLLLVTSPDEMRINRLIKKGLSRKQAAARISSQMPQQKKKRYADYVIENSGSAAELRVEAARLYKELLVKSKG